MPRRRSAQQAPDDVVTHVPQAYRNRIRDLRIVPLSELSPHPHNYRRHPPVQRRALLSNAISVPLDSLIFVTIAFGFRQDAMSLLRLLGGQIALKYALSAVSAYAHHLIPPLRELRELRDARYRHSV